jgi:hypothetical protein
MTGSLISAELASTFARDGVVCVRQALDPDELVAGPA